MVSPLGKLGGSLALATVFGLGSAHAADALHEIKGFRSAHFGMSEQQVRAAVANDFKEQAGLVQQAESPADGVRLLVLPLPRLEPGPGPAGVTYIFGANTKKLIQVNVLWSTGPTADDAERGRLATAGVQLAEYLRALKWRANAATMGTPIGQHGVALFSGIDAHKALVEVSLSGVALRGNIGQSPAPSGPAKLRVAYISSIGPADVAPAAK